MKKTFLAIVIGLASVLGMLVLPGSVLAAGVGPTSGGTHTVGDSFSVNIIASGTTFNTFVGNISVSGPVSYSISQGNAIWDPSDNIGSGGGHFDGGITSSTSSFTIATVYLKGTSPGSGAVSVSGVQLINDGNIVATGGGSTGFTITRAPTPPGTITVTSSTNPDPTQTYGVTTAQVAWSAPTNGATGYSYVFDQTAGTTPPQTQNTTATTASFPSLNLGTYYFHIRAVNGDGWGPTTTFQINIGHVLNDALHIPVISSVSKLSNFTEDVNAGTVSNVEVSGTGPGLAGYVLTLTFAPANMPTSQPLATTIDKNGDWKIDLTGLIPASYYKLSATATQGQTTTQTSKIVSVEFSVANGGTAKIITANDLPKPDLTVKKFGVTFVSASQYHKAVGWGVGIVVGFALICFGIYFLTRYLIYRFRNGGKHDKPKNEIPPSVPPLKKL